MARLVAARLNSNCGLSLEWELVPAASWGVWQSSSVLPVRFILEQPVLQGEPSKRPLLPVRRPIPAFLVVIAAAPRCT